MRALVFEKLPLVFKTEKRKKVQISSVVLVGSTFGLCLAVDS